MIPKVCQQGSLLLAFNKSEGRAIMRFILWLAVHIFIFFITSLRLNTVEQVAAIVSEKCPEPRNTGRIPVTQSPRPVGSNPVQSAFNQPIRAAE